MKSRRLQRIAFTGIAAIVLLLLIELGSFVAVTVFPGQLGIQDLEKLAYSPQELQRSKALFHRLLGWDKRFRTEWGERPRPTKHGRVLVSSFGDSFTYCDEVEHDETWQVHLSERLQADVLNFGVNAYGTDQAYLKFKIAYPRVKTPVVIMGFLLENLNRCRNVFRRFYVTPPASIPFPPKPRFRLDQDGALTLIRSPIERVDDLDKMMDPAFLESLGVEDDYRVNSFPYTRHVVRKVNGSLFSGQASATAASWRDPAQRALMFAILDAFVADAKKHGGRPVLFLEPEREQIVAPPGEAETFLVEYCKRKGYDLFNGIRDLAATIDPEQVDRLFAQRGHASAEGNVLLAEKLHEFLRAHELLEAPGK